MAPAAAGKPRHMRPIPRTGEKIPVIGMGSYVTFNVGGDAGLLADRVEVLRAFFAAGGGMIDSSPMYGSSEAAIGHCLERLGHPGSLFSATKVWTWLASAADGQMAESRELWGVPRFDLMQVHNLLNREDHLETIRREREAGRVRYVGVTTSHGSRHRELETVMRNEPLDFVQLTYNILDREAEERLLPLAAERGIAVIANRPFRRKALIHRFEPHPLPGFAADLEARSWAQFLLKFIVSHPAITCAIPATSRVDHMKENMAVVTGPLPDAAQRRRMVDYVAGL
ncbi:MAG: aldo/keto reductase [Gammaproteobacteria bacterium]|nr:aldo/keto reductase [Gammaproteobacteria bacterium]